MINSLTRHRKLLGRAALALWLCIAVVSLCQWSMPVVPAEDPHAAHHMMMDAEHSMPCCEAKEPPCCGETDSLPVTDTLLWLALAAALLALLPFMLQLSVLCFSPHRQLARPPPLTIQYCRFLI